jgi:hypothetical protein
MEICLRSAERKFGILTQEFERIILGFPEEAADDDAMTYSRFIYSFK